MLIYRSSLLLDCVDIIKQPGLCTISQRLNHTVSNLMDIADASMNRSNS